MSFQKVINMSIRRLNNGFLTESNNVINGKIEEVYHKDEVELLSYFESQIKLVGC